MGSGIFGVPILPIGLAIVIDMVINSLSEFDFVLSHNIPRNWITWTRISKLQLGLRSTIYKNNLPKCNLIGYRHASLTVFV